VKRRIVLLGAPGSGKGTQAEMITRHFALPVTSPGTILRLERDLGTPRGVEADEISKHGGLVPDDVIVGLIEDWLNRHGQHGFVFDGFPRTIIQAERLHEILKKLGTTLALAIWLGVSEETVRARISSRLQCRRCGFTTSLTSAGFAERVGLSLLRWAIDPARGRRRCRLANATRRVQIEDGAFAFLLPERWRFTPRGRTGSRRRLCGYCGLDRRAGAMIPIKSAREIEKTWLACRTASDVLEKVRG
jgi:adenylate kinase family enzyme